VYIRIFVFIKIVQPFYHLPGPVGGGRIVKPYQILAVYLFRQDRKIRPDRRQIPRANRIAPQLILNADWGPAEVPDSAGR
jgi:hypothetical protein